MKAIDTIDQHMIIRDTIGYDGIKNIKVYDLPAVIDFLKIVNNYQRMIRIRNKAAP